MTAPLLDETTRIELTPPCNYQGDPEPCTAPAAWIAHYVFTPVGVLAGLPPIHDLLCQHHVEEVAVHHAACGDCQEWVRLRVEPLDRKAER